MDWVIIARLETVFNTFKYMNLTRSNGVQYLPRNWFRASQKTSLKGSGCTSVDWAVTSDTWGPQFESSRWEIFYNVFTVLKSRK